MNDEIREIEEWLRDISTPTGLSYSGDRTLSNSMVDKIVDYITNLQNENEIRQQDINNLTYQLAKEKSRVEKAVEMLKEIYRILPGTYNQLLIEISQTLNILQNGSENK